MVYLRASETPHGTSQAYPLGGKLLGSDSIGPLFSILLPEGTVSEHGSVRDNNG